MNFLKMGLLPRIIIAIILGIIFGNFMPMPIVRGFMTFNDIFSQFLGFMIPLIIMGLVTPAIADIGKGAGKLLIVTVLIAYFDTVFSGLLAYGTGSVFFPSMVESAAAPTDMAQPEKILPYFTVTIPPMFDVMTGLVFSFMAGLGAAYTNAISLKGIFDDFRKIITKTIAAAIIPLLPLYIFGIFLNMTISGQAFHIMSVFAMIICVIVVLHFLIMIYEFVIAGAVVKKNPFRLLWNMVGAYLTALGTSSSAATIPVTMDRTMKNGVSEDIAGFVVPLCATIHMSGSAMKITACALTICMLNGMEYSLPLFLHFIMMLAIIMVAAPGVPGGAVMAALAPLASILGFSVEDHALMIALYIAMDSFGTACNVTGDGAIAIVVDKIFKNKLSEAKVSE